MQIMGTPREADNMSVFLEKWEVNERQIFVLNIFLGALTYVLKKKFISSTTQFCLPEL